MARRTRLGSAACLQGLSVSDNPLGLRLGEDMRPTMYSKIMLTIIAISVAWIAARDFLNMPAENQIKGFVSVWVEGFSSDFKNDPLPITSRDPLPVDVKNELLHVENN